MHTLHNKDCRDFIETLPDKSIGAIITDPPYLEGDFSYLLPEFLRVAKRVVLTPGKLESFNWIRKQIPTWEYTWKCSGTKSLGGAACFHILTEPVLSYGYPVTPPASDLFDYHLIVDPLAQGHPFPKPLPFIKKLVTHWSNEGEVVFDPFAGTGTTLVACIHLGRDVIGCEKNFDYFKIAVNRIYQESLQQNFLTPFNTASTRQGQVAPQFDNFE